MSNPVVKPRANETREKTARPVQWQPASSLPDPEPSADWTFKWIRLSANNQSDARNMSAKKREGWVPVVHSEHPEINIESDRDEKYPDYIVVGGLMLCKITTEMAMARRAYYKQVSNNQMQAVDNSLLKESDPRMPLDAPHRRSRVSRFGPT